MARAIESMQAQTLSDFEFLIVDDGTPDRSGQICDEYAAKDERIRVFHTANGGAPAARNLAMDKASGKYYYFMDSDDWTEPTMLEDMVAIAERDDAQLVVAGYYTDIYYSDTDEPRKLRRKEDAIDSVEWKYIMKVETEKAEGWQEIVLPAPIKAKYLRFDLLENHGTPIPWTELSEIKIYP